MKNNKKANYQKQAKKALEFIGITGITFATIYSLPYEILPWQTIQNLTATLTIWLMNLFGNNYTLLLDSSVIAGNGLRAQIIPICTGYLELVVLTGFILASQDRTLEKRIKGILLAIPLLLTLNTIRIGITLHSVISYSLEFADLIHDLLFRLVLLIVIVGYYAWWYTKS